MDYSDRTWTPIVAEREGASGPVQAIFPCRGDFNRYTGCIGARKCRGQGVTQCILGRWPDERQFGATLSRGLVEEATAPLRTEIERPARQVITPPVKTSAAPTPAMKTVRLPVGIVFAERAIAQALSRQVSSSGYEPVTFTSLDAASAALTGDARPAALLIDGKLLHNSAEGEALLATATTAEVPMLSLPATIRRQAGAEPAIRMAALWLTITLRDASRERRVG